MEDAARRLSDHACRLNLRGVAAGPVRPGFCPADLAGPRAMGGGGGVEEPHEQREEVVWEAGGGAVLTTAAVVVR